jgi:tRNA A-37 threonylcarbamoyl transferase component Bud32
MFNHFRDGLVGVRDYFNKVANLLGKSANEMHERGYAHRQLHFGNFYHLEEQNKLQIVDWSTMVPLKGKGKEPAMKAAIDIAIPKQGFDGTVDTFFTLVDDDIKGYYKDQFLENQLKGYGRPSEWDTLLISGAYEAGIPTPLIDFVDRELHKGPVHSGKERKNKPRSGRRRKGRR